MKIIIFSSLLFIIHCSINAQYKKMIKPQANSAVNCKLDTDGDGISDCFDKCPNTANGILVDRKGCPLDTDGDGVPDFKDKEKITSSDCQPSDSNGVGKCDRK
jgi:hypothetical protein